VSTETRQRALRFIQQYGWNNTSFQTLEPFFEYWFDPNELGVVAYYKAWGTWVAAGAPICPHDQLIPCALRFVEAAKQAGYQVCFFGTVPRFADECGTHATHVKIGEQPCWNPMLWRSDPKRVQSVDSQCRRAERKGVTVRPVPFKEMADARSLPRQQAEQVMRQWQRSHRMATMSFLVHLETFSFAHERRYFLALRANQGDANEAGEPVGFLSLVPVYAREGFFLEDLIRTPSAPNGTTEALIDAAMRSLAEECKSYASLGLSPLRNTDCSRYPQPGWAKHLFGLSRRLSTPIYNFEGLAAFKSKFRPDEWEEVYVTGFPKFQFSMLIAVLMAFMRSYPAGFAFHTAIRFAAARFRQAPLRTWQHAIHVLAIALILWTVLLSQCDGPFWFGSESLLRFWIAFDCLMVVVLLAIGHGIVRRATFVAPLASAALLAVIADEVATAMHAIVFFSTHSWGWRYVFAWMIALVGPALAATVLAGSLISLRNRR
jgi:phosphatidylglycerol lysyltransferase